MAPPVGPTGITSCSGDDATDASLRIRRLAADVAYGATRLHFTAGGTTFDADEHRTSVAATYEQRLSSRFTFDGSLGAAVGGELTTGTRAFTLALGPLAAVALSYRALDEAGPRPFVLVALSLAASSETTTLRASTESDEIVATDVRAGVTVGKTIAHIVVPYLAARAFGGPVFWSPGGQSATGTDAYHYQLGGGFSLSLGRVDLHLEVAPAGERALACGFGVAL